MKPISIEGLSLDPGVYPPKLRRLRGQPETKRIRKGALNRQLRKCRNCKQIGHNIRRCVGLPSAKLDVGKGHVIRMQWRLATILALI